MVASVMAQTDFINNIDECYWSTNDQKEIFKQLSPLVQYAEQFIKEEDAKIQDKKT